MTKIIHIAGMPVRVGNECRQRCAWCGASLIDRDLENEMVAPGSADIGIKYFGQNELVEVVTGGGFTATTVIPHEDGARVPPGCCAAKPLELKVVRDG